MAKRVGAMKAAEEAVKRLLEGNARFSSGRPAARDTGEARRSELAKAQRPFATVLACSDSRVAPEVIFDLGLGDAFVIRAAGNVVDTVALGSIEFGVSQLNTPVLVLLGHHGCVAVDNALKLKGVTGENVPDENVPGGNIVAVLRKIIPAVDAAKASGAKGHAELLEAAVRENLKAVRAEILEKSPETARLVEEGRLNIVLCEFYLEAGEVRLIDA